MEYIGELLESNLVHFVRRDKVNAQRSE